jgi:hypothetical protein
MLTSMLVSRRPLTSFLFRTENENLVDVRLKLLDLRTVGFESRPWYICSPRDDGLDRLITHQRNTIACMKAIITHVNEAEQTRLPTIERNVEQNGKEQNRTRSGGNVQNVTSRVFWNSKHNRVIANHSRNCANL